MGVAVADHLEVEVVGVPAAGEHRVQLLAGLLPHAVKASAVVLAMSPTWMRS